ncbi:MAG: hypothetical protein ACLQUW_08320 [Desulfobaccales bacterium]
METKKIANQLSEIIKKASDSGFSVDPTATTFITEQCRKGKKHGSIVKMADCAVAALALIAGGMEIAEEKNSNRIDIDDIKEGWSKKLGGTCPVYRCMRRTVFDKIGPLKDTMPYFKRLIEDIKE